MRIKINLLYLTLLISILAMGCQKTSYAVKYPSEISKAETLFQSGEQAFKQRNYKEAIDQYLKSVEIYMGLNGGYDSEIAALYYVIGESYVKVRDYKTAILYFEKSLSYNEQILGEQKLIFASYSYLAELYTKILDSNLEKALEYAKKAEDLAKSYFGDASVQMAEANKKLGAIYCDMEDFDQASIYWINAISLYGEKSQECAEIYMEMAKMYEHQKKYDLQEQTLKEALDILKNSSELALIGKAYSDLGIFYGERGKHEESISNFILAIEKYDECKITGIPVAICYYNMGLAYAYTNDWDNFKEGMRKTYQVSKEIGVDSELVDLSCSRVKESMRIYYNEFYEGDKTSGFDTWFEEFISQ